MVQEREVNPMPSPPDSLAGFPIIIPVSVQWGDQDALGHVNNLIYLRWAETARVEYITRVGLWQFSAPEKIGPILASISCNFLRPVTYPDTIYVGARITSIGNSSMRMAHRIVSASQGEVAAELDSTLVLLNYDTAKSVTVSPESREVIGKLEGKAFVPNPTTG